MRFDFPCQIHFPQPQVLELAVWGARNGARRNQQESARTETKLCVNTFHQGDPDFVVFLIFKATPEPEFGKNPGLLPFQSPTVDPDGRTPPNPRVIFDHRFNLLGSNRPPGVLDDVLFAGQDEQLALIVDMPEVSSSHKPVFSK